jgi:ubiquinone/menaquinone biosynthesis C-methylase UbiE
VVKASEQEIISAFFTPLPGETILDAGCGTGVFTLDILAAGAHVAGVDLSLPMLSRAVSKCRSLPFSPVVGDILRLPFRDKTFDKAISITALEFIKDAEGAVKELFRVTRSKGLVVVATLNSQSPWAERRRKEAEMNGTILSKAIFRSPRQMLTLTPFPGIVKTAVHFQKEADPKDAIEAEREGRQKDLQTGAFVAVCWQKL